MAKVQGASRAEIASRTVLAVLGSYALASAAAVAVARMTPGPPRMAVTLGEMIGFLLFGVAAIVAFSVRSATRAWVLVGGLTIIFCLAALAAGGRP